MSNKLTIVTTIENDVPVDNLSNDSPVNLPIESLSASSKESLYQGDNNATVDIFANISPQLSPELSAQNLTITHFPLPHVEGLIRGKNNDEIAAHQNDCLDEIKLSQNSLNKSKDLDDSRSEFQDITLNEITDEGLYDLDAIPTNFEDNSNSQVINGATFLNTLKQSLRISKSTKSRSGVLWTIDDPVLKERVEFIKSSQITIRKLIFVVNQMRNNFEIQFSRQLGMGNLAAVLSHKHADLARDFSFLSNTQHAIHFNGQQILDGMSKFVSNMQTLANISLQDCLSRLPDLETSHKSVDVIQSDLESARSRAASPEVLAGLVTRLNSALDRSKQLKQDLNEKIDLMNENLSKVIKNQMVLFNNATMAFFAGNKKMLENSISQFNRYYAECVRSDSTVGISDESD